MITLTDDFPLEQARPFIVPRIPQTLAERVEVVQSALHPVCPWCKSPERSRASTAGEEGYTKCETCHKPYAWAIRVFIDYVTARPAQ